MTDKARAIIDYAYEDDGVEMRNSLYSAIQDKVMAHLEAHKQRIAQNILTPQEQPVEEPSGEVA
jgi:basic membrane lipoprotein Med (substrate-binding protein (PBP1-ABC) superfamily)